MRFQGIGGGFLAALIALPYGLTAPITAMFGHNPVLIGGALSVTIPFIAAVQTHGVGGAAKIPILAAVFMLVFSFLRLGRFAVPHSCDGGLFLLTVDNQDAIPAAPTSRISLFGSPVALAR